MLKARLTRFVARHVTVRPTRLAGSAPVASTSLSDDFPKSAWVMGGPMLAEYGVRGTYYTAGSFCGRTIKGMEFYDASDLKALVAAGHEIGCHGFGHEPASQLSAKALAEDAARNVEFLKPFLNGGMAQSYAFPFGAVSVAAKKFFSRRFSNVRGVHPGINQGRVDLAQLNAVSIETRNWSSRRASPAPSASSSAAQSWLDVAFLHARCFWTLPAPTARRPRMLS